MQNAIENALGNEPIFTEAARAALRQHPQFLPKGCGVEEVAEIVSDFLTKGDAGGLVLVWSREVGAAMLDLLGEMREDARVINLAEAVKHCLSIHDNAGERVSADFSTPEFAAYEAALPVLDPATTPAPTAPVVVDEVEVSARELRLREVLGAIYMEHGDELPDGVFGPEYEGWAARFSQPVQFDNLAELLHAEGMDYAVEVVGRKYAERILATLAGADLFELCGPLRDAIAHGVCL